MKYHCHIPELLELVCNLVCDSVVLHGNAWSLPRPLYLHCIVTYQDKYSNVDSLYKWYLCVISGRSDEISVNDVCRLDHVVLDSLDIDRDYELLVPFSRRYDVDDTVQCLHRFASRCVSAGKRHMMVVMMNRLLIESPRPSVRDVALLYGAQLQPGPEYIKHLCGCGMHDILRDSMGGGGDEIDYCCVYHAIRSGDCETIKLVMRAYGDVQFMEYVLDDATVESMEALGPVLPYCAMINIPSYDVMKWIIEHHIVKDDDIVYDIAMQAAEHGGVHVDILFSLIEQEGFKVPSNILARMYKCHVTDLSVIDYLVSRGGDVNAVYNKTFTVMNSLPLLARYWIDSGITKDVMHHLDIEHQSVVYSCVVHGMTGPVLESIIHDYQLDIDVPGTYETSLHHACEYGYYDIIDMLCRSGIDIYKLDGHGRAAYDRACDDDVRQMLSRYGYVNDEK